MEQGRIWVATCKMVILSNLQGCKAGRKRQAKSEEGEMSSEEQISCLIFEGHTTMLPINSLIYPSAISDA